MSPYDIFDQLGTGQRSFHIHHLTGGISKCCDGSVDRQYLDFVPQVMVITSDRIGHLVCQSGVTLDRSEGCGKGNHFWGMDRTKIEQPLIRLQDGCHGDQFDSCLRGTQWRLGQYFLYDAVKEFLRLSTSEVGRGVLYVDRLRHVVPSVGYQMISIVSEDKIKKE